MTTQHDELLKLLTTFKLTTEQLADHLMTTQNTIQVTVYQLRQQGYPITTERAPGSNDWRYALREDRDE